MKIFSLFLLLTSTCFLTATAKAADKWTGNKKVQSVQIVGHGGMIIFFDSEVSSTCSAAGTSSIYVYPNEGGITTDGVSAFLSVSLTALSSGMTVNAMYDDSTSHCWGRYLIISK